MNREYIFFLKYNLNIVNMIITLKHIYCKIINLSKKIFFKKNYPKKYQYLMEADFITERVIDRHKIIKKEGNTSGDTEKIDLNIFLATKRFNLRVKQDIFQRQTFKDPEDYESIHRFQWIRYYLSKKEINLEEIKKIESLIIYWCELSFFNDKRINDKLIWESYTVSERITNIIFFYNKIEKDIPVIVAYQLDNMTKYVIKNLEFYNSSYGNHLINNFRGILFYATFFQNTKLIDIFSDLINQYLEDFIEDGFTKDFSSHYQLLVYFWLYDLSELAKRKSQKSLLVILDKYTKPLHEKSLFFYSRKTKHYSLFGDISPDLSPTYLISLLDREYLYNNKYSALYLYQDSKYVG